MAKIQLHRILIPATELFRKQGGHTLVMRLEKNANASKTVISGYLDKIRSKSSPRESAIPQGNLMERLPRLALVNIVAECHPAAGRDRTHRDVGTNDVTTTAELSANIVNCNR